MSSIEPVDAYYHPAEFRVGEALSRAFDVLFGNFFTFVGISAVATLPQIIYQWTLLQGGRRGFVWVPQVLQFTLASLCTAMILYATFQALRGRPVSAIDSAARGLQRFIPVVVASFLTTIVVTIGSYLLLVPGLIWYTMFSVTLPACVVEKLGPIDSMSRSSELTRGYRWPIFGALFAVGLAEIVVIFIIAATTRSAEMAWINLGLLFVATTLFQAYQAVLVAIIYHDLRVVKDGIDLDHIASVFD